MTKAIQAYLLAFIALTYLPVAAAQAPVVVVSIKPIHSLVSNLMSGIARPELLMSASSDPHHFNLRPSQRRLINRADLIVWVGPELETALNKVIQQSDTPDIALLHSALPQRYPARLHHSHEDAHRLDAHIWLSTDNARFIVRTVAAKLMEIDSLNSARYDTNLKQTLQRIDALSVKIKSQLSGIDRNYIAYHDAYQYFEKTFSLQASGFVKDSDSTASSMRNVRKLDALIESQNTRCLIYDSSTQPGIFRRLARAGESKTVRIQTLGQQLSEGEQLWFDMMMQVAQGFHRCLR